MKRIVFLFIIVFSGFSCPESISFDGSERYRIKGKVTDDQGNPLKNIGVSFEVLHNGFLDNSLIQKGMTDKDGKFDLIFSKNNGNMYFLKLNYIPEYWQEDTHQYNEQYSEKNLFFYPERFSDHEFDVTPYCSLVPGVVLNFVCDATNNNSYSIHYETEQDTFLDSIPRYNFQRQIRSSKYINSSVLVPQNSKIKLYFYSNGTSSVDSIYTTDVPFTYTFK